jgi:L-2,4-diaminobutyric acid acetyltransferase|tara:strand:+ start:803 stop:1315 length:513 start_codon:yes stop_codon:yes gene_type:complete
MSQIVLRKPEDVDGFDVHSLIASCPPLDTNSMYCNLLQCTHFSNTSVLAVDENSQEVLGFISGYIMPADSNTLFIWQVAVSEKARGQGLAKKMLFNIINRNAQNQLSYLETTITDNNPGSWALFGSVAKELQTELIQTEFFTKDLHFQGVHDTENLVRIGPFNVSPTSPS